MCQEKIRTGYESIFFKILPSCYQLICKCQRDDSVMIRSNSLVWNDKDESRIYFKFVLLLLLLCMILSWLILVWCWCVFNSFCAIVTQAQQLKEPHNSKTHNAR